ncbi:HIRAN domain-containing protein [Sphingomonas abietis]|uniref:HIRAN domain-containing protein n=1 Tax=Sphingomonas abietis TaxID=3012344 RepID=A0ABY7NL90_9SPHN|nr:HIRAN domain-containing protein [Sphingomonas abietis]WBO22317.1 HIRAN domain-containing protein [Sphingomonas abietis]
MRARAAASSAPAVEELTVACVGARFANPKRKGEPTGNREMEIMFTEPGDVVARRAEPENTADANAIAVYAKTGVQIGYISADRSILIRQAWAAARDVYAIFQQRTPWGAWLRIGLGREPTLPPASEKQPTVEASRHWWPDGVADVDDFYPDYIPPDD